ncbi:hypothetical protein KC363_g21 [Hortaea werneckii]|nr:hypothetical protein KC363_g21 [Hortaea werneckii]
MSEKKPSAIRSAALVAAMDAKSEAARTSIDDLAFGHLPVEKHSMRPIGILRAAVRPGYHGRQLRKAAARNDPERVKGAYAY